MRLLRRRVQQSLHDLSRETQERVLDIDVGLGGRLDELYTEGVGEGLTLFLRNDPLFVPIALVANQDLVDVLACVLLDVAEPGLYIFERFLVRDIVDEQDPHGAAVVHRGNGTEPLLSRSIPDLQLDSLSVNLYRPDLKVDTNRGDEGRRERVFGESQQQARLAHARVADQQELDEVVIVSRLSRHLTLVASFVDATRCAR